MFLTQLVCGVGDPQKAVRAELFGDGLDMGWGVSREGFCSASPLGDTPDFQRGPGGYRLLLLAEPLLTSPSDL